MDSVESMHWPLSVLSRAIHFKNLTSASAHVGLSQPQLSRLVSQLEKEFNVTLLDRSARRKSGWTKAARRLAEIYSQNNRKLQDAIQQALDMQVPREVRIGTLEGLSPIALHVGHALLRQSKVSLVELDVYDQNDLEQKFLNNDLDLILSSRTPGKQKFKHVLEIGFQTFQIFKSKADTLVVSPYEFGIRKKKVTDRTPGPKTFISNSLALRRSWLDQFGGEGAIPSIVQKQNGAGSLPVLLIGTELFHESLWAVVTDSAGSAPTNRH